MKRIDLTGQKFNHLTVEGLNRSQNGTLFWDCICDCGKHTVVRGSNLKNGSVKSCGCINHIGHTRTHGESHTKLYERWISMIYRCTNPKHSAYKWYGARGIRVCNEWQSYEGYKKWVMATRPNETYTVERIDVDGDYCPDNCKWIPLSEQANNRTSCIMITHEGVTKNLTEWCSELGLEYKMVHNRLKKLGWTFEKAISTPVDTTKRNKARK